jgi:hypothetical protein
MRNSHKTLVGKPSGLQTLGRPKHDGRIIVKWIFKE